jgi:hypothetical protein
MSGFERVTTFPVSAWHPHLISGKPSSIVLHTSDPMLWFSVRHVVGLFVGVASSS